MDVPVAGLLFSVLSHVAGPLMAIPSPDHPIADGVPDTANAVTISIADGKQRVRSGQTVRYEVVVRNAGIAEAPLVISLRLPDGAVQQIRADQAAVVGDAVAWKTSVPPGQATTYSLAGRLEPSQRRKLEVTACIHSPGTQPALACATDSNQITLVSRQDRNLRWAWIAAILFGLLAVGGALWLHRKVNPPLLTPAQAAAENGSQPGGAPSA